MVVAIKKGPHSDRLTGPQAIVLFALLTGKKKFEAAQAAGVHPQAVSEMLRKEHFVEALHTAQARLVDEASGTVVRAVQKALAEIMKTLDANDPALRFRAATYVLDRFLLPSGKQAIPHPPEIPLSRHQYVEHIAHAMQQPSAMAAANKILEDLDE